MKEKFTRKDEKLPRNEKQPLKNVQNPPGATTAARAPTTAQTQQRQRKTTERRGEKRREEERRGEEVKLCEGREGGEMMKTMCLKNTKKRRGIGKKWLFTC